MPTTTHAGGLLVVTVSKSGKTRITASLHGFVFEEDGLWVSHCPPLDLATQGRTKEEAIEASKEAIDLFFKVCLKGNMLDEALTELNWRIEQEIQVSGLFQHKSTPLPKLPPSFMIDNFKIEDRSWSANAVYVA